MKRVLIILMVAIFVVGAMLPGVSALAKDKVGKSSTSLASGEVSSAKVYKPGKKHCKVDRGKHKGFNKKAKHKGFGKKKCHR